MQHQAVNTSWNLRSAMIRGGKKRKYPTSSAVSWLRRPLDTVPFNGVLPFHTTYTKVTANEFPVWYVFRICSKTQKTINPNPTKESSEERRYQISEDKPFIKLCFQVQLKNYLNRKSPIRVLHFLLRLSKHIFQSLLHHLDEAARLDVVHWPNKPENYM